ncbi:MAG TPA: discoidin domain-containing protein, partial [Kofleriaceae bacterium]|nr:discoidin domain-containing protein [Kofleriaceae bacterium]
MTRPKLQWTLVGIVATVVAFAILGWHRRWIADDGLIVVRTVRNMLAGNGPVFNAFERAEANTSTLWTYVLVAVVGITRAEPAFTAVVTGWVLSVGGLALALDATRRFHRDRGSTVPLVPAGAFVLIGTQPFWDYATSGLETGLCTFWLAACWWLLVAVRHDRLRWVAAIVFGLGPLVRPDFALASVTFCVALWWLVRPTRRATVGLAAAALALPVAYEIFRAGYYGTLVPLPALAKGAGNSAWERGFLYLVDYVRPYFVFVPIATLIVIFGIAVKRGWIRDRAKVLVATMTITSVLLAGFVLRVGGDFMHGRMLLPATFVLVLPALLLPSQRVIAPALALIAVWATAIVIWKADGKPHATAIRVADERHNYSTWTKTPNPTDAAPFLAADAAATKLVDDAVREHHHLLLSEGGLSLAMNPAHSEPVAYAVGRLGTGGATAPLDGIVVDVLGLANPLGARITVNQPGMTGHEKSLPWSWIRADFTDPAIDTYELPAVYKVTYAAIRAARHALTCGELAELMASVREPMTGARFWANLKGAVRRTRLVVPVDPFEAEAKFCRDHLTVHEIKASSSYEADGWSAQHASDGVRGSTAASKGFSSEPGPSQWIELDWLAPQSVAKVTLYPRADELPGLGFPIDLQIQIWDGAKWVDR